MELFFRKTGLGDPMIILHGLYGSSDNWISIARALAGSNELYLPDLRNHGRSPHHAEHNYKAIGDDLIEFMAIHNLTRANFLGHSMGGKAAFAFGMEHPDKVNKMILVDISPFEYDLSGSEEGISHSEIIQGLLSIQPESISSRGEADILLQKSVSSQTIRQFLLKNLKRDAEGKYFWGLNLPVIAKNLPGIFAGLSRNKSAGPHPEPHFPLLFIRGEFSRYINSEDEMNIRRLWPKAKIITIKDAGHWVHAEQPGAFLEAIRNFIGH